jgi:DNA-binding transcriptional regulator GbsR (MarR family)
VDEDRERYVEDFGLLLERFGLPRMVGRVLGVLLVSEAPEHSAEDLAGVLRASRGSISSATRTLVQMGLVERRTRPGERRDYFRVGPGAWDKIMYREMESLSIFREMAERGLSLMNSASPQTRQGWEEMCDLYAFWEMEMPTVLERWKQDRMERAARRR